VRFNVPTRFNIKSTSKFGVSGIKSGYEPGATSDLSIAPCTIEDIDEAMFNLFSNEIRFQALDPATQTMRPVNVVFASGEKWAMVKRSMNTRDHNRSLKLPLIAIGTNAFMQSMDTDITGRGVNQHTGEMIIRRRLDNSDRNYQALINRLLLKNQQNLAVSPDGADAGQLTTTRTIGELSDDPEIVQGGYLKPNLLNNVYETIVVPTPQFYTQKYEIIVWTQYTQHINGIVEMLLSSMLPQVRGWRIDTKAGYWFVARVDEDDLGYETNFDDMSTDERMLKLTFTVSVQAALFASSGPGVPIPVKRYVSSPNIQFTLAPELSPEMTQAGSLSDPFLGADDPTLPLTDERGRRDDQRNTGRTRLYQSGDVLDSHDPALGSLPRGRELPKYKTVTFIDASGRKVKKRIRVATINRHTGETSFAPGVDLNAMSIVDVDD
jgi:hypothetical protein